MPLLLPLFCTLSDLRFWHYPEELRSLLHNTPPHYPQQSSVLLACTYTSGYLAFNQTAPSLEKQSSPWVSPPPRGTPPSEVWDGRIIRSTTPSNLLHTPIAYPAPDCRLTFRSTVALSSLRLCPQALQTHLVTHLPSPSVAPELSSLLPSYTCPPHPC